MYVDLAGLFEEFSRLPEPGGRSASVSWIDAHHGCVIHPRGEYFRARADHNLMPVDVIDLIAATIP